jgi:glycerol-3-phosphate dehydrogenase
VLRKLRREWPRPVPASLTRDRPLPGALPSGERDALLADLSGRFGAAQARRLWRVYGGLAAEVAALAAQRDLRDVVGGVLTAELAYAVASEWAVTLEDVLQRRCMVGLDGDFGLGAAPAVADALVRLGLWDGARAARELAVYRELAARHGATG